MARYAKLLPQQLGPKGAREICHEPLVYSRQQNDERCTANIEDPVRDRPFDLCPVGLNLVGLLVTVVVDLLAYAWDNQDRGITP